MEIGIDEAAAAAEATVVSRIKTLIEAASCISLRRSRFPWSFFIRFCSDPGEASGAVAEGAPVTVPTAALAPAPEPVPVPPPREPAEPGPRPTEAAPLAGPERAGAADLNWYAGRDLDVLPRPLGPVEPLFPLDAQLRGVSGKVTLALSIDATGRVVDVSVVRSDPPGVFEASALAAFRSAPFAPGIKGGRPVQSRIQTVVVFEIGGR